MSFNFDEAIAESQKDSINDKLCAVILGPSGGGKSSVLGTFGVKTLYLYGSGEDHGISAAQAVGGDVVGICWDKQAGQDLKPDASFHRLTAILTDIDGIKSRGFGAVVIDGATELENLIQKTDRWANACLTDKGKHNNFAETGATGNMFRIVIQALKNLHKQGIHVAITCLIDVRQVDDEGAIVDASPRLGGYMVAEGILQQFGDVLLIGRMTKDEKVSHRLQFNSTLSKVSKDAGGTVKKLLNFSPRLSGITLEKLPVTAAADLKKVAEFKAKGGKK